MIAARRYRAAKPQAQTVEELQIRQGPLGHFPRPYRGVRRLPLGQPLLAIIRLLVEKLPAGLEPRRIKAPPRRSVLHMRREVIAHHVRGQIAAGTCQKDRPPPNVDRFVERHLDKASRSPYRGIDVGRGIPIGPAVVVMANGLDDLLVGLQRRQRGIAPRLCQRTGQVRSARFAE